MFNTVRDSQIDNETLEAWAAHPLVKVAARRAGADLGTLAHLEALREVLTDMEDSVAKHGTSLHDMLQQPWNLLEGTETGGREGQFVEMLERRTARTEATREGRAKAQVAFGALRDGMSQRQAIKQFGAGPVRTAVEWLRA